MRTLDERARDHGAVLQHVVEVDEVAVVHVLRVVVRVVEVNDALLVRLDDLGGEKIAHGEVLGDLAGHVVALDRDDSGVLVGVLLLDLLVVALDEGEDLVVRRVLLALLVLDVAVDDVLAGNGEVVEGHELVLDEVLDLLDGDRVAGLHALVGHVERGEAYLALGEALVLGHLHVGLADGVLDLGDVERDLRAVALDDLHVLTPSLHNARQAFKKMRLQAMRLVCSPWRRAAAALRRCLLCHNILCPYGERNTRYWIQE